MPAQYPKEFVRVVSKTIIRQKSKTKMCALCEDAGPRVRLDGGGIKQEAPA